MSYLKKSSLLQQQQKLKDFISKRLKNEKSKLKERVYQWLNDNQYFVDNELFDFYFCVAQNIAAVEVLGGSGEQIVKAKTELEESVEVYTTQIVDTSNWINEQLKSQLEKIQHNQQNLDIKLIQVLKRLATENQNLQTTSNGLVNSTSILLKKQKQLVAQTKASHKFIFTLVVISWSLFAIAIFILVGEIIP